MDSLISPILTYPDGPTHYSPQITLTSCADTISNFSGVRSSIPDSCICMLHREVFFPSILTGKKGQPFLSAVEEERYRYFKSDVRSLSTCHGIVCISHHLSLTPIAGWGLYIDIREGYPGFHTGLLTKREANTQCDKLM